MNFPPTELQESPSKLSHRKIPQKQTCPEILIVSPKLTSCGRQRRVVRQLGNAKVKQKKINPKSNLSATLHLNQTHWQLKSYKNRKAPETTKKILNQKFNTTNTKLSAEKAKKANSGQRTADSVH